MTLSSIFCKKINSQKLYSRWVNFFAKDVYSRWVADQLAKGNADVQVNDIFKNLPNGVFLVELSTALTGKDPKREWNNQFNNSLKIKIFTIIMLKSSVVTC